MRGKQSHRVSKALVAAGFGVLATGVGLASSAFACSDNAFIFTGFMGAPPDLTSRTPPPGPTSGTPGSDLLLNGREFYRGAPVEIHWNSVTGSRVGSAPGPSFSVPVKVPDAAPGVYYFVAVQQGADGVAWKKSVPFEVLAPAVESPVTNPPVTNPPVTNPPVTNPPVSEPSVQPPVVEPPAVGLPVGSPAPAGGPPQGIGSPPEGPGGPGAPPAGATGQAPRPPAGGGAAAVRSFPARTGPLGQDAATRPIAAVLPTLTTPDGISAPAVFAGPDGGAPAAVGLWHGRTNSGRAPSLFGSSSSTPLGVGRPMGVALAAGGVLLLSGIGTAARRRHPAVTKRTGRTSS